MYHAAIKKLLVTSALLASCSFMAPEAYAQTYNIAVTGDIPAIAPADAANGTTGSSATNGTAGYDGATFTGATVTGTVIADVTGQKGGNGGTDTNGSGGGTSNGGNGGNGGAGITLNAQTSPTLVINSGVTVRGGAGGNGGSVSANNGNGGTGGSGGVGVIANSNGAVVTINGTGAIAGGTIGTGGFKSGSGSNGSFFALAYGMTVSENTTINFTGSGTITGGNNPSTGVAGIRFDGAGKTLDITGSAGTILGGGSGNEAILLNGGTINNAAIVGGISSSNKAVDVNANSTAFNNTGNLSAGGNTTFNVSGGRTLIDLRNTGSGVIRGDYNNTISISGTINNITNSVAGAGGIRSVTAAAIFVNGGGNVDVIDNTGGLITSGVAASTSFGTITLTGNVAGVTLTGGTIQSTGGGNALAITTDQTGTISSSSALTTTSSASVISFSNAAATFVNTGAITGRITSTADAKIQTYTQDVGGSLTGTGTVIDLNDGADVVNLNGGTITGNVNLGAGGDTFTFANVTIANALTGTLEFGTGTNTFAINESMTTAGAISSTGGTTNATVATSKSFSIGHAVNFGAGSLTNNGSVFVNTGGALTTNINGGSTGDTISILGGTIAGNVDMGAGNDTFSYGNAGSATALNGTLAFGSGTNLFLINESMTTTGAMSSVGGSTNVTVASGKTFTIGHAVNFGGGTFNNQGITVINDGQSLVANGDSMAGGRYIFGLSNATAANGAGAVAGLLDLSGGSLQSAISAANQIEIQATGGATLTAGAQFRIVHGGAAETTDFTGDLITDNSALFNFRLRNGNDSGVTFAGADVNDIIVEVVSATMAALDLTRNAAAVNVVTTAIGGTGGATFDTIQTNLGAAATSAELNELYEALAPSVDNSAQDGAVGTSNQVIVLAETRISGNRRDLSSGSEELANRMWLQGFGKTASQDKDGIYDGYDADTYGTAIGIDGLVGDGLSLLGVALSYGQTQIDADNATRTDTDIDSYQITFYGDRNFSQGSFIEGFAAYARNDINSVRHNVGGVAGLNAHADYSASTYAVRGGVGHNFMLPTHALTLIPKLTAAYAVFDPETYTETGAGGASLRVDGDTSEQLNLGVNVELNRTFTHESGALFRPSVNVGYRRDMLSDAVDTTSTFMAGGAAFTTKGAESEKGAFTAGLGMEFFSTGHWQMTAKYDLELKNGYDAHAALLRAGYRF